MTMFSSAKAKDIAERVLAKLKGGARRERDQEARNGEAMTMFSSAKAKDIAERVLAKLKGGAKIAESATAKLIVPEDDLSKACAKVGRFLHEFALVEQEINNGIVQILDLKGDAADVIAHDIDFFRKVNLLKIVALETAPETEKESIGKLFSAVAEENNDRILMAHSRFEPAAADVQFRRTVAKGIVKKLDPLWTQQDFEDSYKRLRNIREKLTELRPMLTLSINEDGRTRIFHHYLYTPASSGVPLPLLHAEQSKNKPGR